VKKTEVLELCTNGNLRDCTRYIQAVTLHRQQSDWSQKVAENKGLFRNNYDRMVKVISHELSGAQHPTGAQIQIQQQYH